MRSSQLNIKNKATRSSHPSPKHYRISLLLSRTKCNESVWKSPKPGCLECWRNFEYSETEFGSVSCRVLPGFFVGASCVQYQAAYPNSAESHGKHSSNPARQTSTDRNFLDTETVNCGGGPPREKVGIEKFNPSFEAQGKHILEGTFRKICGAPGRAPRVCINVSVPIEMPFADIGSECVCVCVCVCVRALVRVWLPACVCVCVCRLARVKARWEYSSPSPPSRLVLSTLIPLDVHCGMTWTQCKRCGWWRRPNSGASACGCTAVSSRHASARPSAPKPSSSTRLPTGEDLAHRWQMAKHSASNTQHVKIEKICAVCHSRSFANKSSCRFCGSSLEGAYTLLPGQWPPLGVPPQVLSLYDQAPSPVHPRRPRSRLLLLAARTWMPPWMALLAQQNL